MKTILVALIFLGGVLSAAAYQAGPQNRTNFGSNQSAQAGQQNYRSFSTYKQRNWSQGVQTQRVQTETAGKSAVDFEKKAQKPVGKTQAVAPKEVKPASQTVPTQPSSTTAAMPANADPAAMMQQVQNMMSAMGNMGGAQPGQPGAAGQAQAGQNAAAMPAGMPDISALMGGALPTPMAPAANPAKK